MLERLKIKLLGIQPKASISSATLERLIKRDFPDKYNQIIDLLKDVSSDNQKGKNRISAAILKLANGDSDKVAFGVSLSKIDYRDTLSKAEYPRMLKEGFSSKKRKLIYMEDWQEYSEWLKKN